MNITCLHCQSTRITKAIQVVASDSSSPLTIQYEAVSKFNFASTKQELLRADICEDCGTIARFYVENNKNWLKS
jgi:hypothetical protein